jgi:hypothetical protein
VDVGAGGGECDENAGASWVHGAGRAGFQAGVLSAEDRVEGHNVPGAADKRKRDRRGHFPAKAFGRMVYAGQRGREHRALLGLEQRAECLCAGFHRGGPNL